MEFRILGPLEVEASGRPVPLGEPQQQIILGTLLLEPGKVVPLHRLVDAVWDQRPPATATKQIRNRAAILRRLLAEHGFGHEVIATERVGYRLITNGARVDALLFEELVRQAGAHRNAGLFAEAAQGLRRALALCRGPLLDGLASTLLRGAAATWDERRYAVLDDCLALELALGRHRELLDELTQLTIARPLSECIRGKLMMALYRSGRRAEALAAYEEIRRRLDDELGIEPGTPLQQLYVRILRSDPTLDQTAPEAILAEMAAAERGAGNAPPRRDTPAQLPADLPSFVGRTEQLRQLDALLADGGNKPATAVISALSGTAGVGKPKPG